MCGGIPLVIWGLAQQICGDLLIEPGRCFQMRMVKYMLMANGSSTVHSLVCSDMCLNTLKQVRWLQITYSPDTYPPRMYPLPMHPSEPSLWYPAFW